MTSMYIKITPSKIPIYCRLLPTDQWLKTHLDTNWTVREVKVYLLARFANPSAPFQSFHDPTSSISPSQSFVTPPSHHRATPSEISIASSSAQPSSLSHDLSSSVTSFGPIDEGAKDSDSSGEVVFAWNPHLEYDPDIDDDEPIYSQQNSRVAIKKSPNKLGSRRSRSDTVRPPQPVSNAPPVTSPSTASATGFSIEALLARSGGGTPSGRDKEAYFNQRAVELGADHFVLCSFSTGQLLEDHLDVASYRFRPNEMIEIQRTASRVYLPRTTYTHPYFDAPVCVHVSKEKEKDYFIEEREVPTANRPTHHRPHRPYRSHSTNFQRDKSMLTFEPEPPTLYDVFRQPVKKGKDKEREWELVDALHGGVFTGTSPPPSYIVEEDLPKLTVKERKEKVGKSKEWKMRWLVIREDRLLLWKDRALDAYPAEEYPISSLSTVRETPLTPNHLLPSMPKITTTQLVNVKFTLGPSKSPDSSRSKVPIGRSIISVHIRLLDSDSHDHFLRVIYRSLRLSMTRHASTTSLTRQGSAQSSSSPPTLSSSWLTLSRFKGTPPPESQPTRPQSPSSSRSSSPQQPPRPRSRSRSPVSSFKHAFRHRHVRSLSRTQSTPSLSGMSRSSRSLSRDDGEDNTFPPHPAVLPLHQSPKYHKKIRHRQSHLHLTSSPEKERQIHTDTESFHHISPSSIASSPNQHQKLSSSISPPSISLLPPHQLARGRQHKSSEPSPMGYINWRERVVETCATAGRGEAYLRRVGKRGIGVWGPFQFDEDEPWEEDGMVFGDVDEEIEEGGMVKEEASISSRRKNKPDSRRASFESDGSEFEWENWKLDANYNLHQHPSNSFDSIGSSTGLSRSSSASGKPDLYPWKGGGGIASIGKSIAGTTKDVEPNRMIPTTTINGVVSFASFADAVVGRARSKSVITITPRRPSSASASSTPGVYSPERSPVGPCLSPWSPPPRSPDQQHPVLLTSPISSTSPFYYSKRSTPGIPTFDSMGRSELNPKDGGQQQKRPRSSTISNPARAPIPTPPSAPPPPMKKSSMQAFWSTDAAAPPASFASQRRRDSAASDISLNSALNMYNPPTSSSNSSNHHTKSGRESGSAPTQPGLKLNTSNLTASGGGISISKASPVSAIRLKKPTTTTPARIKAKDVSVEISKTQ